MKSSSTQYIQDIREELTQLADEKIKEGAKRYFKEEINGYGIKAIDIRRIAKTYGKAIRKESKAEIFEICEALWKSGFHEEGILACLFSYAIRKQYEPQDSNHFDHWIEKYVTNWALCDTLCNHNVGTLVEMYPEKVQVLKKWALSKNRWKRRAAAVSLIIPAKKGLFLEDVFDIATALLTDSDDLVQKGYGWMLKVATQHHLQEVFTYIMHHKQTMPRTALRYAIEKMPSELRAKAMA